MHLQYYLNLAKGLVVTIEATIVASLLAYILGLGIAILKMSKSKANTSKLILDY